MSHHFASKEKMVEWCPVCKRNLDELKNASEGDGETVNKRRKIEEGLPEGIHNPFSPGLSPSKIHRYCLMIASPPGLIIIILPYSRFLPINARRGWYGMVFISFLVILEDSNFLVLFLAKHFQDP